MVAFPRVMVATAYVALDWFPVRTPKYSFCRIRDLVRVVVLLMEGHSIVSLVGSLHLGCAFPVRYQVMRCNEVFWIFVSSAEVGVGEIVK